MEAVEEETCKPPHCLKALVPLAGVHERVQWLVVGLGSGQVGDARSCSCCQSSLAQRPHGLLVAPDQVGAARERGYRLSYQLLEGSSAAEHTQSLSTMLPWTASEWPVAGSVVCREDDLCHLATDSLDN